jgi:CHAT domain-containing protein
MQRFIITGLLLALFQTGYAQQDTSAMDYYFLADSVFRIEPENPVITHYLVQAWNKVSENEVEHPGFRGYLSELSADYLYELNDIDGALEFYEDALEYLRLANEKISDRAYNMQRASWCYYILRSWDINVKLNLGEAFSTEEVYYPISDSIVREGDVVYVELRSGSIDGIYPESAGKAYGADRDEWSGRDFTQLGHASVVQLDSGRAMVMIDLDVPDDEYYDVYEDDYVLLYSRVPEREYRSIWMDFALQNIMFYNQDNDPMYDYRQLLAYDSEEMSEEIMYLALEDVRITYDWLKDVLDEYPQMDYTIESGKYKGREAIEILKNVTDEDVYSFLGYVETYPWNYMGNPWNFNDVFATWVINDAKIGFDEFFDLFMATTTIEEIEEIYEKFTYQIKTSDWYTSLHVEAENYAFDDLEYALAISDRTYYLAEMIDEPVYWGWWNFTRAKVWENADYLDSAVVYYEKGANIFNGAGDLEGESFCWNNSGYCFDAQEDYPNASKYYNKAYEVKLMRIETDSSSDALESIGRTCIGLGDVYYYQGLYRQSVESYTRAIEYFLKADNLETKKLAVGVYDDLALSYKEMGDYRRAYEIYEQQYQQYVELGDAEGQADVLDDIADVAFDLGSYRDAYNTWFEAYEMKFEMKNWDGAGFSLSNCAQSLWNLGELDSTLMFHREAIWLRKDMADYPYGAAYSYNMMGRVYQELGDLEAATLYFDSALTIYTTSADSQKIGEMAIDQGDLFLEKKDYDNAKKYYNIALDIFAKRGMKSWMGDTYASLGAAYYNELHFAEARIWHEKALEIRKETGSKFGEMYSLTDVALIDQYADYAYDEAERKLNLALELAKETESADYIAFCNEMIGHSYYNRGKMNIAIVHYNVALDTYRNSGNVIGTVNMLCALGAADVAEGNFRKGMERYEEALELASEKQIISSIANAYNYMGEYYYLTADFPEAFRVIQASLDLYLEDQNEWGIAGAYLMIGNTYNYVGNIPATLKYYAKSDSVYKIIRDELSRATTINNIGTIHYYQGDYDNALEVFYEAEQIMKRANYSGDLLSTTKWNIGEVYYEKGILSESLVWVDEAKQLAKEANNKRKLYGIQILMGKVYKSKGDLDSAEVYFTKAYNNYKKIGETLSIAEAGTELSKLYLELGNTYPRYWEDAETILTDIVNTYREIGSNRNMWEPLFTLSEIASKRNEKERSVEYLMEAVEIIEEVKGQLVGGPSTQKLFAKAKDKQDIYENLVTQLIDLDRVEDAFYYQEKMNVQGLTEQTRGNERGTKFLDDEESQNEIDQRELIVEGFAHQLMQEKAKPEGQRNEELIKELEQRMTVAEQEYQNFVDSLMQANSEDIVEFSSSINPRDLDMARDYLPDEAAVVEYLITDNQTIIFVATYDDLEARVLDIQRDNLEGYIDDFYYHITHKSDLETVQNSSEQLYQLLIDPVKELISPKQTLALVPTGRMYKLPFQALGYREGDNFRYLINDHELFYINDMRFITMQRDWNMDEMSILAFGNSDETLPYAEDEVNMIDAMFENTSVYVRAAATEDIAKNYMVEYPVVHFATHGNLDPVIFKNSYLTLAPNQEAGEDGRLTIEEIRSFRRLRNCQLIVLSACNTAVNEDKTEGWINNPAKEFITKGAKSVVATLWQVDDAATGQLMENFYSGLKDKRGKADCLQEAQKDLIASEDFHHPYYWSAFELIGEWK